MSDVYKNEEAVQGAWGTESPSGVQGQSPSGDSGGKAPLPPEAEKLSEFT